MIEVQEGRNDFVNASPVMLVDLSIHLDVAHGARPPLNTIPEETIFQGQELEPASIPTIMIDVVLFEARTYR